MTLALILPFVFVVFAVVHYLENVDSAAAIEHAADQSKTIVTDIEHDTSANDIGRPECLFERCEIRPLRVLSDLVPSLQISLRHCTIVYSGFPELP